MPKYTLKLILLGILLFLFLSPIQTYKKLDEAQVVENERILREELKIYLTGRFNQTTHKDFIKVSNSYLIGGSNMYLRKETYDAFKKMHDAAKKDGVTLLLASATRNFEYQKMLWDNKWTGRTFVDGGNLSVTIPNELERFKKILEYSAAPSTSRHHWGTDIDINGASPEYFETETGKKVYSWLNRNAMDYGFCQTYNEKGGDRTSGYNEEKWHWSYLPLAKDFTQKYKEIVTESDIYGFMGEEQVQNLNLIEDYVLSINPECL